MNVRFTPLFQDVCGILALASVSLGLGIFAQTNQRTHRSPEQIMNSGTLPHPVVTLDQLRLAVDTSRYPILDARPRSSYDKGHVPGAWSVPSGDFDASYDQLPESIRNDKDRLLIVYCSDLWCELADELQQKLINRGHRHVGRFPEGWKGWQEANSPKTP